MKETNKTCKRSVQQDIFLTILFCFFCVVLLLAPAQTAALTLAWDPNPERDVAGYKIYSGTSSRSYSKVYDAGKFTSLTIANSDLRAGTTYYFAAKAYNTSGLASGFSNEVSYKVPASTSTGTTLPSIGTTTPSTGSTTPSTGTTSTASGSLLYADRGSSGIWGWNGSTWIRISTMNPEGLVVSGFLLYADCGTSGTWRWNGSSWTRISTWNPESLVVSGTLLYADYGTSGTRRWNGSAWTTISTWDPESLAAP